MIPVKLKRGDTAKERRPRRDSDSSTLDRPKLTPEEREARDKRRREREAKHRERATSRESKSSDITVARTSRRSRRPNAHVDVVDKLDVTGGLYGVSSSRCAPALVFIANLAKHGITMAHLMLVDPCETARKMFLPP